MYKDRGLGYVILDRRPETVVPAISKSKPGICIIVDEEKLINHVLPIARTTIFRRSDDDHAYKKHDARQFVRQLAERAPNRDVYLYLGNEPGRSNLPELSRWTLDALDECNRLGRKGVALNFETGVPEALDWQRELAPVLEYIKRYGHVLGLHEYADSFFLHPDRWHIGRWAAIPVTQRPRIFITELGYAKDLDPHNGWQGNLPAAVYAKQLHALNAYYSMHDIPAAVFSLGDWHGFDVTGITEKLQPPRPVAVRPTEGGAVLRAAPSVFATRVTVVAGPTDGLQITPTVVPGSVRNDAFGWWPVHLSTGQSGWMREDVVRFTEAGMPITKTLTNTPFYSQSSSTATLPNDCGIAAARMVLGWFYQLRLGRDISAISVDDVSKDVGLTGSQLTATTHVTSALEKYGTRGEAVTLSLSELRSELVQRRPVILLVNAGLLGTSGTYGGPHWVVAAGLDSEGSIQILDPLTGEHWVPLANLDKAWEGANQQGNPARRVVRILV
jgi:hypothetical protein